MKIECPHCSKDFERSFVGVLEKDQTLSMTLSGDSEMLGAAEAGEALTALSKTLKATAKALNEKIEVYLSSAKVEPNKIEFQVACVPFVKREKQ